MKRILSIVICLCLAVFAYAVTDPFRAHKYDLFKVLPVNDKSIVFVGNSIKGYH